MAVHAQLHIADEVHRGVGERLSTLIEPSQAAADDAAQSVPSDVRKQSHYRGRFAPTPTGPLHFGSLIAALASYCDARSAGGEWLVRIEDVDTPRTRAGAEADILRTLEGYGFEWNGSIVRQCARTASYKAALSQLVTIGRAYPCACSRRELVSSALSADGERIYPGHCRDGIHDSRQDRAAKAWRVRVDDRPIRYCDRVFGERMQVLSREVGDFIVKRADGLFAYQLAVVVDDALQGITDVVRGADLASSTPRQILLQRLLGYASPSYLHVPVATTSEGQKLSKQTLALPLPADPVPPLMAAWRFLAQAEPQACWQPASIAEFWWWAHQAWKPARIAPRETLCAPAAFR